MGLEEILYCSRLLPMHKQIKLVMMPVDKERHPRKRDTMRQDVCGSMKAAWAE